MKQYIAIWKQDGEGCDYTIGCGVRIDDLGSHEDMAAATNAVVKDLSYDYHLAPRAEGRLKSVTIHEVVATHNVDLEAIRKVEEQRRAEALKTATEAKERAELDRLRRKFVGT